MTIQPKKSLGQNFLRDEKILQKIIEVSDLKSDDFVLEIGPGEGALTKELIKKSNHVLAIEIDQNLLANLQKKFQHNNNLKIISGDILKINLKKILTENNFEKGKYKLIANIPYYITSAIIRLFLETKIFPNEMILMVQKEVAERIVALPGAMSLLSLSVQYYATAEKLFDVSKNCFFPVPEVDSAIIRISKIKNEDLIETKNFFRIARVGFSAKRKTLANNLANGLHLPKEQIEKILAEINLSPNVRAQELSVEDWKKLSALLQE